MESAVESKVQGGENGCRHGPQHIFTKNRKRRLTVKSIPTCQCHVMSTPISTDKKTTKIVKLRASTAYTPLNFTSDSTIFNN